MMNRTRFEPSWSSLMSRPTNNTGFCDFRDVLHSYKTVMKTHSESGLQIVLNQQQRLIHGVLSPDKQHVNSDTSFMSLLLMSTSQWLAKSFSELHSQVKTLTNKFKSENIQSVDDLPPAKDVCLALFPRAMVILFEEWLTVTHGDSNADHTAAKKRRQTGEWEVSVYPFIQLILEFANNTLISGVAHVLFTRLILDDHRWGTKLLFYIRV